VCKLQVPPPLHFRDEDDLARMIGEMFGDVIQGLEAPKAISLNRSKTREVLPRQLGQHATDFIHGSTQMMKKLPAGQGTLGGEFLVALAVVGRSAQP
jgi:hypothetical protein